MSDFVIQGMLTPVTAGGACEHETQNADLEAVRSLRSAVRDRPGSRHALMAARDDIWPLRRAVTDPEGRAQINPSYAWPRVPRRSWRARQMVADSEFDGEAALLATIFLAGHSTAVVKTARLASNGETLAALVADY